MRASAVFAIALISIGSWLRAQGPNQSDADFATHAAKLREAALRKMDPQVAIPTTARTADGRYPWKTGIVTTVFWIGTAPNGKRTGGASAWDPKWQEHYGGFDDPNPEKRQTFIPVAFVPRLNPFYIALPYN